MKEKMENVFSKISSKLYKKSKHENNKNVSSFHGGICPELSSDVNQI